MRFKNNNQRMAVMARLRQAGFSKVSSDYIMRKIKPVRVVDETKQYIILTNSKRAHLVRKPEISESSCEKRIDRLRAIRGYEDER